MFLCYSFVNKMLVKCYLKVIPMLLLPSKIYFYAIICYSYFIVCL